MPGITGDLLTREVILMVSHTPSKRVYRGRRVSDYVKEAGKGKNEFRGLQGRGRGNYAT